MSRNNCKKDVDMRKLPIALLIILLVVGLCTSCKTTDPLKRAQDFNSYGVKCIKTGLWREAELRFRQALDLDSQMAIYHNNLAVALEAQGRINEALEHYETALKLDPANQEIYNNLTRFKNVNNFQ